MADISDQTKIALMEERISKHELKFAILENDTRKCLENDYKISNLSQSVSTNATEIKALKKDRQTFIQWALDKSAGAILVLLAAYFGFGPG